MPSGPVFRWNGTYFGFFAGDWLFNRAGKPLAWVDSSDHSVWRRDGSYLGQVINDHYILRNRSQSRSSRAVPSAPANHVPHVAHVSRVGHVGLAGWEEALDALDD